MQQIPINSSEELNEAIRRLGCDYTVIGRQRFGREVLLVKTRGGDTSLRPILVTGGAHTDEPAGILAACELIRQVESERPIYIIPCRDPLGFDGLRRCLQLELGSEAPLGDCHHLRSVLQTEGETYYQDEDLVIAGVGETVFTVYPPWANAATYFCEDLWPEVLQQTPEIVEHVWMRRFMIPGDRLYVEDWDAFGPASATRYMHDGGKIRCPDTVIGTIPPPLPPEIDGILAAIDGLKPALTLDLHEGGADGYYMFADAPASDIEVKVAHAMSAAVAAAGGTVTPPEEIITYWIEHFGESVPGLYTHIGASAWSSPWKERTLAGYARKYGDVMVTETGRAQPLAKRVAIQVAAVRGAIEAFDD
jgi:hypothetical protein